MTSEDRFTLMIYYDILRGIHRLGKAGKRITISNIGREASVPNGRLKLRLAELQELGLELLSAWVCTTCWGDGHLRSYAVSEF